MIQGFRKENCSRNVKCNYYCRISRVYSNRMRSARESSLMLQFIQEKNKIEIHTEIMLSTLRIIW